jgi:uncharacterized protein
VIFIDTGAFIARYVRADQLHRRASLLWAKLERSRQICVTSNFVVDELLTYLGRRTDYNFAAEKGRHLYSSERLTILRSTHEDELHALAFLEKYADQQVSFTDCVSFALMRQRKIDQAFSFDRHFSFAGFRLFE